MKRMNVFINWVLTLVVGGIIASLIFQRIGGFIFSYVAMLMSLPYLVLMLLVSKSLNSFLKFHGVHLLLTSLTSLVLYFNQSTFVDMPWLPFLYFGLSVLIYFPMGVKYGVYENVSDEAGTANDD
jgi:hypothetical protein